MFLLQVIVGSVASMLVGMVWYSPSVFGRVWWKLQFPHKQFGECGTGESNAPLFVTMGLMVAQSVLLTYVINTLTLSLPLHALLLAVGISILIGTATLPHYLFGQREVKLFLVCYGHDIAQISAAVGGVYIAGYI